MKPENQEVAVITASFYIYYGKLSKSQTQDRHELYLKIHMDVYYIIWFILCKYVHYFVNYFS